jgi:pteridine reductase
MKLALVTGGMKRLGARIAARLAMEGWSLALHSRGAQEPDPDLAAILAAQGTPWKAFEADLSSASSGETLMADVQAAFGAPPTALINNASRFIDDDWQSVDGAGIVDRMITNAITPVMLGLSMARALAKAEVACEGCIINILDQRIRQPIGDQLSYTLSKQALAAATETLARTLAPNVRVNGVAPGLTIPTEDYRPAQMVALEAAMPLKRLPEPDDIADAVLWLLNAQASSGQIIYVDGGASLKSFERDFVHMGSEV